MKAAEDLEAMAALSTCTMRGLIPHAKHGGIGVCGVAVVGSKLVGIGLEKEHIGQIQVLFCGRAPESVWDGDDLVSLSLGDEESETLWRDPKPLEGRLEPYWPDK